MKAIILTIEERDDIWEKADAFITDTWSRNTAPYSQFERYAAVLKLAKETETVRLAVKRMRAMKARA